MFCVQLTLYAIDGGDPPRTGSILVDVAVLDANDNRPEFERSVYEVRVPESTPIGSVLVQVRAKDRDAGLNGNVRYKFSRHTAHEYATLFGIRPDNGKIFLHRGGLSFFRLITPSDIKVNLYGTNGVAFHSRRNIECSFKIILRKKT